APASASGEGTPGSDRYYSGTVVGSIHLDEVLPLVRHGVFGEDSAHRADRLAGAAVDALIRIDVVLGIAVGRMDAIHRADLDARSVFHPNTWFSDHISHAFTSFLSLGCSAVLSSCTLTRRAPCTATPVVPPSALRQYRQTSAAALPPVPIMAPGTASFFVLAQQSRLPDGS